VSLREVVHTVRTHWLVALITFLVCVGAGAAYAVLPAKQYQARVVLVAQPPANATDPGSDVGAIQIEIPEIVVEAGTPLVQDRAKRSVPAHLRSAPVTITATGDPSSNSVTIEATSPDPRAAQAYADATAAQVVQVTNLNAHSVLVLSQLGSAELPTSPTNPRGTVAVAAVVLGLIAAVFAALAAAALRRWMAADGVWDRVGVPIIGEVPVLARPRSSPAAMFESAADPRALEAFQQLRSYLHIMFQDEHPVIAITSCDPREGKSSVAAHTAWALATPGHFVVAVDGDLRQPTLDQIFGLPLSPGVSDYDSTRLADLMTPTGNPYLVLVPAGVPFRHPTDIAAADAPRLLRTLKESERTVVLDCPPITGVAETTILVARADAVIVVVDSRKSDPERLAQGLEQLRSAGAHVVGIVLNRVRRPKSAIAYAYGLPAYNDGSKQPKHNLKLKLKNRLARSG
jgi:capsular exopolysaccharide synthesis family protein